MPGARGSLRKCLWKWLFFGHSQSCLKVALWVLQNMEALPVAR